MHKIGSDGKPEKIGHFKIAEILVFQAIRRFFRLFLLKSGICTKFNKKIPEIISVFNDSRLLFYMYCKTWKSMNKLSTALTFLQKGIQLSEE